MVLLVLLVRLVRLVSASAPVRFRSAGVGVESLSLEVERVRQVLMGSGSLGDIQLFSQLKALGEVKAALVSLSDPRAIELQSRVDKLLEASLRSGRFAQL